jgi:predicted amidophosphoribosyltransferase
MGIISDCLPRLKTRLALALMDAVCQHCRQASAGWLCERCATTWATPQPVHDWLDINTRVYSLNRLEGLPKRKLYGAKFYDNTAQYWWCVGVMATGMQSISYKNVPVCTAVTIASHTAGQHHWMDRAAMALQLDGLTGAQHHRLYWTRPTQPQHTRPNPAERWQNVQNAFHLSQPNLTGPVILLDDVTTTGATLYHAALAIRQAGYEGPLTALTLCYVPSGNTDEP